MFSGVIERDYCYEMGQRLSTLVCVESVAQENLIKEIIKNGGSAVFFDTYLYFLNR